MSKNKGNWAAGKVIDRNNLLSKMEKSEIQTVLMMTVD